jgi:hypothetical protein
VEGGGNGRGPSLAARTLRPAVWRPLRPTLIENSANAEEKLRLLISTDRFMGRDLK